MKTLGSEWQADFRSLHPAFSSGSITRLAEESLFVFDFDGVVISRKEELVYRLPESDEEREILVNIAEDIGVYPKSYNTKYLRHIVYQYALEKISKRCEKGPLFDFVKSIKKSNNPFYVITARSALPAVRRALAFLEEHKVEPTEIFFVGRVGKGRQLSLLQSEFARKKLYYFDDSIRHFTNARKMTGESIESIHVDFDDFDLNQVGEHYRAVIRMAFLA